MSITGGIHDIPAAASNPQLQDLASFAVAQNNLNQNSNLQYLCLISAKQQIVAGAMYYLEIKASLRGVEKIYEAKVWEKPWLNFKSLEEFKEKQSL